MCWCVYNYDENLFDENMCGVILENVFEIDDDDDDVEVVVIFLWLLLFKYYCFIDDGGKFRDEGILIVEEILGY